VRRLVAVALLALPLAAGAQDKKPEAGGFDTPEKTYEAYRAVLAESEQDWAAVYAALTSESAERVLGENAVRIATALTFAKLDNTGKMKEKLAPSRELLEKAGLTDEALEQAVKQTAEAKTDTAAKAEVARKLVANVKDKPGLFRDLMKQMESINPNKAPELTDAKLKDVKIDSEKATATLGEQTLTFIKGKDGWRLELPEGALNPRKGK